MAKKAFLFDMEGPIIERPNFWVDYHTAYGDLDEVLNSFLPEVQEKGYVFAFQELYVPRFWNGVSNDLFMSMIEERAYTEGIFDLIEEVKRKGYHTVIISSGPYQLAERAQKDLKIDSIFANRINFNQAGLGDGTSFAPVDDHDKSKIARIYHESFDDILAIGDGNPDVKLIDENKNHILFAYNAKPDADELRDKASHILEKGQLKEVLNYL